MGGRPRRRACAGTRSGRSCGAALRALRPSRRLRRTRLRPGCGGAALRERRGCGSDRRAAGRPRGPAVHEPARGRRPALRAAAPRHGMATSVAAFGKVRVLEDAGQPVPEEWMRDGLLQLLGAPGLRARARRRGARRHRHRRRRRLGRTGPDDQGVFLLAFDPRASARRASSPRGSTPCSATCWTCRSSPAPLRCACLAAGFRRCRSDPAATFAIAPALSGRLAALGDELGVSAPG